MIATLTTFKLLGLIISLSCMVGIGFCVGLWFACTLGFRPTFDVRRKTKLAAETQRHGDNTDGLGSVSPRLCGKSSSTTNDADAICRDILRSQEDVQP
jgi:hypothetical protein